MGIGLYLSRADYATTYDYGQTGFMDTVSFITLNTTPNDIIVSMKDIGFRAHRRYYENYFVVYGDQAAEDRLTARSRPGPLHMPCSPRVMDKIRWQSSPHF